MDGRSGLLLPAQPGSSLLAGIPLVPLHAPASDAWGLIRRLAASAAALMVLTISLLFVLLAMAPRLGAYATFAVLSPSMEPAIRVGAIVIVTPVDPGAIHPGDVLTATSPAPPFETVTHRVVAVAGTGQDTAFTTRGDANGAPDPWQLRYSGPAGKVVLSVPLLGYALVYSGEAWFRTALALSMSGLLLGVALPLLWPGLMTGRRPRSMT